MLPRQPLVAARGDDLPDEVVAEFYAAAVGLLTWWIDHDFGRDPTPAGGRLSTIDHTRNRHQPHTTTASTRSATRDRNQTQHRDRNLHVKHAPLSQVESVVVGAVGVAQRAVSAAEVGQVECVVPVDADVVADERRQSLSVGVEHRIVLVA